MRSVVQSPSAPDKVGQGPAKWRSTRFLLAYTMSTGLMVVFYQRVSFSMAIVCMVNHTALAASTQHGQHWDLNLTQAVSLHEPLNSSVIASLASFSNDSYDSSLNYSTLTPTEDDDGRCHRQTDTSSSNEDGPFLWDKQLQGLLLGALYWGYTVIQVPASYVIQRKGPRLVVGAAIVVMSVLHWLCHPAALLSPWAVFALRVGIGLCSGISIPAMYSVWQRWAPVKERSQLMGIAFAGQMVANASVFPASASLCEGGFLGGWPAIFHVFGLLGLLWCFAWFCIVSNTPESHPRINPAEKDYIVCTRPSVSTSHKKQSVPWKSILTAPCFWAVAVSQFTYNWGFFLMISNLPLFLYEAMDFDIQSNGLLSMMPYICLFFTMAFSGFLADFIITRRLLSVAGSRRLFTVVGYIIPAALMVAMSHQHCSQVVAVAVLLVLAVGLSGMANVGGFYINPYDIAPRFSTHILVASNTMACVAGVINPYVVAALTPDKTREQWQHVFHLTAGIFVLGTVVFCLFVKGEVQPWAQEPDDILDIQAEGHTAPDSKDKQGSV